MGEQGEGDMAVPAGPQAHLVLIQPDLAFSLKFLLKYYFKTLKSYA